MGKTTSALFSDNFPRESTIRAKFELMWFILWIFYCNSSTQKHILCKNKRLDSYFPRYWFWLSKYDIESSELYGSDQHKVNFMVKLLIREAETENCSVTNLFTCLFLCFRLGFNLIKIFNLYENLRSQANDLTSGGIFL